MSDRQLAGIAVGPDSVAVTLVSGLPNKPLFADPVVHKLQSHTPQGIASAVSHIIINIDGITTTDVSIALSIPVALAWHDKHRYDDVIENVPGANIWCTMAHSNAGLKNYPNDYPVDEPVDALFLDLTPGHPAARLFSVEKEDEGAVYFSDPIDGPKILETPPEEELSPQDLINKLVTTTIDANPNPSHLHGIYIFRPEGSCAALSSTLHSKFPATPIKWVSLSDISRGAAIAIHSLGGEPFDRLQNFLCMLNPLSVPFKIALADGRLAVAIPRNYLLPLKRTFVLTTSRDGQSSATVQFVYGTKPFARPVMVELVDGKPKGASRIQVCVDLDGDGDTVVCVEEVGSGVKTVAQLGNVLGAPTGADIEAYLAEHDSDESPELQHYWDAEGDAAVLGDLPA